MAYQSPYNANPELATMRDDIAKRSFRITMKSLLIAGAIIGLGVLAGVTIAPMLVTGMSTLMTGYIGGAVGMMLGGHVANLATLKDKEKLQIDQKYVESYTQGKGNWGEGYRKEVAEHGYSLTGPVAGWTPQSKDVGNQR